jgi:hypothetical protein
LEQAGTQPGMIRFWGVLGLFRQHTFHKIHIVKFAITMPAVLRVIVLKKRERRAIPVLALIVLEKETRADLIVLEKIEWRA